MDDMDKKGVMTRTERDYGTVSNAYLSKHFNEIEDKSGPNQSSKARHVLAIISAWKRYLILFFVPVALIPLPVVIDGKESKAAYVIIVMAVYWVLDVFSIAVTALIPLVLFPILGVIPAASVASKYLEDVNVLFLGGLIVAVSIEHWCLHKRFALRVLLIFGTKPERLLLGFMVVTAFISMFISDTATAAMMMPIGEAVICELEKEPAMLANQSRQGVDDTCNTELTESNRISPSEIESSDRDALLEDYAKEQEKTNKFGKTLLIAIAYSSAIGGTATLTGTGPNLIFAGQSKRLFPKAPEVTYLTWAMFAFPQMIVVLLLAWLYITLFVLKMRCKDVFLCCSRQSRISVGENRIYLVVSNEYKKLGHMRFAEKVVLGHFVFLVLLWIFRSPKIFPGWSSAFIDGYVTDGTAAIIVVLSLFAFPSEKPKLFSCNRNGKVPELPPPVLTWETVSTKLPWGIILLIGCGFAIAEACEKSGLSIWVGSQLTALQSLPGFAAVMVSCLVVICLTEITSNVATATILLPILGALARTIQVHPWYIMLPATIASSFAFVFPISTPPNAIAFATGRLHVSDMVKVGLVLDVIALLVLMACINSYGMLEFDFKTFPEWAKS